MNFTLKIKTLLISYIINLFNGDNYHNVSKFFHIYKIWNNIKLDKIDGDYIEFGIFKGKALLHSVKTYRKLFKGNKEINFYGLDSFEGFPEENHNFYNKENFAVSYEKVKKIFNKFVEVKIYKGFFSEVLKNDEFKNNEFSFVFIDCDIYESAKDIFDYIDGKMSTGAFLMIDDFTSIDQNGNSIYKAFHEHSEFNNYVYFTSYSNGQIFRYFNDKR